MTEMEFMPRGEGALRQSSGAAPVLAARLHAGSHSKHRLSVKATQPSNLLPHLGCSGEPRLHDCHARLQKEEVEKSLSIVG